MGAKPRKTAAQRAAEDLARYVSEQCTCGHLRCGHLGAAYHAACVAKGCTCERFTWDAAANKRGDP